MQRLSVLLIAAALLFAPVSNACPKEGCGEGQQHRHGKQQGRKGHQGHGKGMQCRADESHDADMEIFHFLLDNRTSITRTVTQIPDGVDTLTESDDPAIAGKIRDHVTAMKTRLTENRPIHMRDPLFAEIFANADKVEMTIEETEKGVRVRETSEDDYVAKLIQAHAEVIDKFLENGRSEARKNHEVPVSR
jgi:hypothetical protein